MTTYDLPEAEKSQRIEEELNALRRELFEHEINITKWSSFEGDYSAQIEGAEQAISNLASAINALSDLA